MVYIEHILPHDILDIAKSHLGKGDMVSSAQLCFDDAYSLWLYQDKADQAEQRALKSLAYSVGILHDDYKRIKTYITARNNREIY